MKLFQLIMKKEVYAGWFVLFVVAVALLVAVVIYYPGNKSPDELTARVVGKPNSCANGVCGTAVLLLHFNEQEGIIAHDNSSNGHNGTLLNLAKWITDPSQCVFNGCLSLEQSFDYVNLSIMPVDSLLADEFTISFWAKSAYIQDRPTFGFSGSGFSKLENPLVSYDTGITIGGGGNDPSNYQLFEYYLPNAPKDKWSHYAFVDNGTAYLIYVDGKLDYEQEIRINPGSIIDREFMIGESGYDTRYADNFNGFIDEFIIYGRALTGKEVAAVYNSPSFE